MPFTPDEQDRVTRLFRAANDPSFPSGDAFSIPLMINLFMRIVKLRDFAAEQVALNQNLLSRLERLERIAMVDDATAVLNLEPSGVDSFNE